MDRVVIAGCVLLVLLGASFGVAVNLEAGSSAAVRSALEVASFVSTIVASGIAVYALTTWREAFRHGKKFDALQRLKAATDGFRTAPKYLRYSMMHGLHSARRGAPESDFLNESFKSSREAWDAADSELSAALDECELFIEEAKFRRLVIQHIDLRESVSGFRDEMLDLMFREEIIDESAVRQSHLSVESKCIELVEGLIHSVKVLRSASLPG